MLFISTQDNLAQGLGEVTPLAGRNIQLESLGQVLCRIKDGGLELVCTDLEAGVRTRVSGKVESEGSCTVTARTLFDYVQQLPKTNPIKFELKEKVVEVSTEGFQANFPVGEVDDFPLLPEVARDRLIKINAKRFCEALNGVMYAAARDMTRPEIHSVLVAGKDKTVWLAATDSFRLSEEILELDSNIDEFSLLLPLAAAQEVVRLYSGQDEVYIYPQESHVTIQGGEKEFTSRLIEGKYPDYKQIIPVLNYLEYL